jgi:hypothetical protein
MGDSFIFKILSHLKCPSCGRNYDSDSVRVKRLGDLWSNDLWLVDISCHFCGSQAMALCLVKGEDLFVEKSDDQETTQPIQADDVIGIHKFMRDFGGDFRTLFLK